MSPYAFLAQDPPASAAPAADSCADPTFAALAKAGTLLVDLSDQAVKLAVFIADDPRARSVAGSLCRRAELTRHIGRKLALFSDPSSDSATTLINDAILALDGVAVDVEYAAELAADVKVKNQIARARLAVTTAGCAIDEARHAVAAKA